MTMRGTGRTLLERIVESRRATLARERRERAVRRSTGEGRGQEAVPRGTGTPRSFESALRSGGRRIIAEIKRRSPSAGMLRDPLDARILASQYEHAGAAALSVLTEPEFFGGSDADLVAARAAVRVPVLMKDFIVDTEQVSESRALGADAVLLLVSVLTPPALASLIRQARAESLAALVEVHDERELDIALEAGASILGVNNRDLRDFSVDPGRAERLAKRIPDPIVRVAESGIRSALDIVRLEQAGYHAFLVGETLLRSPDPGVALRELLG